MWKPLQFPEKSSQSPILNQNRKANEIPLTTRTGGRKYLAVNPILRENRSRKKNSALPAHKEQGLPGSSNIFTQQSIQA